MSDDTLSKSMPVLRQSLGLTEAEATTIVPIYLGGNMTAGGVSLLTGEKLTTVTKTLSRLVEKGLVKEIPGIVPVYRALAPSLALSGTLSESLKEVTSLVNESEKILLTRITQTDEAIEKTIDSQNKTINEIRTSLTSYEENILNLVKSQIEQVVSTTTNTMTSFSDEIEQAMIGLDTILDENLGSKLLELQGEIDKAQLALEKDMKTTVRDFDKWLKPERKSTFNSITEFGTKSGSIVASAKATVTKALSKSSESIHALARDISEHLTSLASTASDEGLAVLNEVSKEISQLLNNLDGELSQAYLTGQESLKEVITQARSISKEYGEFAKNRIGDAVEIADSVCNVVEDWKNEVSGFMEVASQSVTSQLNQVASTDAKYLEATKTALTLHIDKVNGVLSDEYGQLISLTTVLGNECENSLAENRTLVLELLQAQIDSEQTSCESAQTQLDSALNQWVGDTVVLIEKRLKETSADVSSILGTEISELNSISDTMNSRLKSAFNSVIKSTSTKNESLITSLKQTTHDFEANIGSRLEELISSFTTATENQVRESKELYEGLRNRLDQRMSQSVNAISTQSERIQKEIGNIITEQNDRIEQHTLVIRNEFHSRLEEITTQFISLTQGLEATFNGLLSAQTVEARDIIASAHSEFRNSLKNEVAHLKDDSVKLQQEYSAELVLKVEEVASSVSSAKKTLEELLVDKRTEISENMQKTLTDLESIIRSTEESLRDIESGTVKQFIENMEQVSQEFNVTVEGASANISERLDNIRALTASSLEKSVINAKKIADEFVQEQKNQKQRFLADTSKKMNRLSTKSVKDSAGKIEAFQTELSERQTIGVKDRSTAKEDVLAAVETRRAEVANAFDAAATWVDSSVANVATSLDAFGTKLKNELTIMQKGLQKSANEASTAIEERGDSDMDIFEEMVITLLQNAESLVTARLNDFGDSAADALSESNDSFTSLPTKIGDDLAKLESLISEKTSKDYSSISGDLATSFTEFIRNAESASEDLKQLVENISVNITEKRDEIVEQAKRNAELSNQHASRKFESIGLELKTQLSTDTSRLLENARSTFSAKNLEINDTVTKVTNTINEETSSFKQKRTEALSQFGEQSEKALKRWSSEQKDQMNALKTKILETINGVTEQTQSTISMLDAIHSITDSMIREPSKRTWYLSGTEEIYAHIVDMANRAEESIVISLIDIASIDLKKLGKVKQAKRRVLIVPESEDPDPALETLDGWRIWQTKNPMLLSIADDKELLVGGATDSKDLVALISEHDTYLRLYHDVIGPRLVKSRVT
ncbi:MAG: hypothetical protein JW779_04225 [Candidatus Thorarchaeota archaeon]|nr:hypothetical protein [Candidatus Thorarchaeota archaeon]